MKPKIAVYARVSSNNGRQDVENQLEQLRLWAIRLDGDIIKEYVDEASGCRGDRAALTQLLKDAHQRKFDVLLIWALDRLSREGIARLYGYLERLKQCGIRVMSHQESWLDSTGPVSDLLIAVFGWVAKQERERISERVRAGLQRVRKTKKLGRPCVPYNPLEIMRLRANGATIEAISKQLAISTATVCRTLQNPPKADSTTH